MVPFAGMGMLMLLLFLPLLSAIGSTPFLFKQYYNASGGYNDQPVALFDPQSMAWGNGKIYIGDSALNIVLAIDGNDVVTERIGGGGTWGSSMRPMGLLWSPGALYIADADSSSIIAFYGSSIYSRVGPQGLSGHLPTGVWVENATLWMLDTQNDQLLEYNMSSSYNTVTYFGRGFGTDRLSGAQDIVMDANRVYIADSDNNRVQVYDRHFKFLETWGTGRGGVSLLTPRSVASDGQRLYVADTDNNRVVVFGSDGYPLQTLTSLPDGSGFDQPIEVRLGNNTLFVLDAGHRRVAAFALNWTNSQSALLSDIDTANRSVQAHNTSVIVVMDSLGVSHTPYVFPSQVEQAYALVQAGQYGTAATLLTQVRANLQAVRLGQIQALRTAIQTRIDVGWAALKNDKGVKLNTQQTYQQTVLTNHINEAQTALSNEQYGLAAQTVLILQTDLTAWGQTIDAAWVAQNQSVKALPVADPRKAALSSQADLLDLQLQALQEQMANLHQNDSLQNIQTLMDSARVSIPSGDYAIANNSLSAAAGQLADANQSLIARAQAVNNASQAIAKAWAMVNSSQQGWMMMGIDPKPIVDKLTQAQAMLYTEPQQAGALAAQAEAAAGVENTRESTRGAAIAWMGFGILAVIVLGLVAFALLRTRAPRGGGSLKDWVDRRMRQTTLKRFTEDHHRPGKRGW